MPQSPKKIVETLTTEVTDSGDECVDRQPRTINQKRADVDGGEVSRAGIALSP